MGKGLHCLNFTLVPQEGEPGLNCHPSQTWGKQEKKEEEFVHIFVNSILCTIVL